MISIVTAYFNRKRLFIRTLQSLKPFHGKIDFEIIAVDDGSKDEERLEDLVAEYPFMRILRIEPQNKWYMNPCIPFNMGLEMALGDKIVLQNPECFHYDNILEFVDKQLQVNNYLAFGCFSVDMINTDDEKLFFDRDNINDLINQNTNRVLVDGGLGWYNHSKYRPNAYHFCTAIMASDLVDLGGFDMRYALGHGFDDDDLIFRIKKKGIKINFVDNVKVLHQNHYYKPTTVDEQKTKYLNSKALRNKLIYNSITERSNLHRANYITINKFQPVFKLEFKDLIRKVYHKLLQKTSSL